MRGILRPVAVGRALGLAAAGAGLLLGAGHLPATINAAGETAPAQATRALAEPVTQTRLICPGPQARGVQGLPDSPGQSVSVVATAAPVESLPAGVVPSQGNGSLTISGLPPGGRGGALVQVRGRVVRSQVSTARSALVSGVGAMAPGTVATQTSWTRTGSRRSLVTTACTPAQTSSWLIAGGAAPGRLEHLVLANPGPNPVTADLSVFGVKGRIDAPEGQGLVVAGHSRIVILLDAFAGSEPSPVVHVAARGGKVAAVLNDTWLDGVVPRGGDDVVSQAPPTREQVIAGLPINGRAIVRLAVPGQNEAVAQTQMLTAAGPVPLQANGVTRVAGRSTKDIDLGSMPAGAYAVRVRADVPVLAAVLVERRRSAGTASDLAWSAASAAIRTFAGMALPAAQDKELSQRLDLAATNRASVRVATVDSAGRVSTKTIAVAADSVSALSLNGAVSVWVTPVTGTVRAAVVSSVNDAEGTLLSVAPLADLALTAAPSPLRELAEWPATGRGR